MAGSSKVYFRPVLIFAFNFFGNDCIRLSCLKRIKKTKTKTETKTRIHVLPGSRFSHNQVNLKMYGLISVSFEESSHQRCKFNI